MATKTPVHSSLEGLKAKALPKVVKGLELPELTWQDSHQPLDELEIKHLVTLLRDESQDTSNPVTAQVVAHLNRDAAEAWSAALLSGWEAADSPSNQKWMLFQRRQFADRDAMDVLCGAHDWIALASAGKWARANWYLATITSKGATPKNIETLFALLSEGKLDGTLQKAARTYLEAFAEQAGKSTRQLLEDAGLIGVKPTRALPFEPGKSQVLSTDDEPFIVDLRQGELVLLDATSRKRLDEEPEDLSPASIDALTQWRLLAKEELLRWGGYLHHLMTSHAPITLDTLQKDWFLDPIAQSVLTSLLWRTPAGAIVRVGFDEVFDVDYEEHELAGDTPLLLVQLSQLDPTTRDAWYEHLGDNEMLLPFDILQRDTYLQRIQELLEADYVESEHAKWDVIGNMYNFGYLSGHPDESGAVLDAYKTFPSYNTRVFLAHSGFEVGEGDRLAYPSTLEGVSFKDLFGNEVSRDEVYVSVLAETVVDLIKINNLEGPPPTAS